MHSDPGKNKSALMRVISSIPEGLLEDNSSNYKKELSKPIDSKLDGVRQPNSASAKESIFSELST